MTTTVSTLFRQLLLPQRMRLAAEVLAEATDRYDRLAGIDAKLGERGSWDAANLRRMADRWEADDKEAAEKDKLARELADAFRASVDVGGSALDIARALIDNGWTKTEP